ncbi:hypothetical protein [Wolbachia endosymbiont of Aedes albopictus]|nr:hypothetical protein [Wolbachia endosymbiont of Aedes albopictus]UVW83951.1 hypothetical protein NHG98_00250 [Wolbachia endosymbiont of Aedes albopictus]
MLGITEKYNQFKKSTYFAGGKFVIYAACVCLAATFAAGCLGTVIGSPLLTLPLAMLISRPMIWIAIGIVLAVVYKVAVEPLFYSVRGYFSEKEAPGRFCEDLQTLAHQTNRGNYAYWLQQHDIAHIARIKYGYSEDSTGSVVFFCIPGNLESLNERLREYKNKAELESLNKTFTSVVNLGGNHWVTLVVAYNLDNKQFRAYYCDSFSADLPSPGSQRKKIELANEIKDKLVVPLTDQAGELNMQGKKEMSKDVQETAQTCRDRKNELVNVSINIDNMVSALEAILKIRSDNIKSSKTKQQNDGCNCGIFALENACKITQMFNEGKSLDKIDKELSEYKFDLNEKRREFAEALMNDQEWKKDLESGFLYELPPRTKTSSTSEVQHVVHNEELSLTSCPCK